ncbi:MAG: hypothetical protein KC620_17345, partial [Myxococcales bacterium]|nr:hypothetical protein [Myxococcales bacterium]
MSDAARHATLAGMLRSLVLTVGLTTRLASVAQAQTPQTDGSPATVSTHDGAGQLRGLFMADAPKTGVGRLAVRRVDGETFQRVPVDHAFAAGDAIRFEISANRAGRFEIWHADRGDEWSLIWPPADRPELATIAAHAMRVVPPAPA